ncbi:MAG: hypothetical protein HQM10_19780 [Candidatus Riflebacteria bacterium]|nr:hypothetical protein [Candidatus Riflebacteria bacterium]
MTPSDSKNSKKEQNNTAEPSANQQIMMVPMSMEALSRLQGKPEEEDEIDLGAIFMVLWARKGIIVGLSLLIGLLSLAYSFTLTPVYKAEVSFMPVEAASGSRMQTLMGQLGGLSGLFDLGGADRSGAKQFTMILKSRMLATTVAERFPDIVKVLFPTSVDGVIGGKKISKDMIATILSKNVTITTPVKDNPPTLAIELSNATMAAEIANAYMDELASYINQNTFTSAKKSRIYIEEQTTKYQEELSTAEEELKNFQQANKLISVNVQTENAIKIVGELKAKLLTKEMEREVLLKSTTANNPEVKRIDDELSAFRSRLNRMEEGTDGLFAKLKTEDYGHETQLMSGSLASAPELLLNFYRLKRKVEIAQKVYELLMQQLSMARITEQNESSSFKILDPALIPKNKIRPKKSLYGVMGSMTGFFISLIYVFVDHRRKQTKRLNENSSEGTSNV